MADRTELAIELQSLLNHIRTFLPDAVVSTRLAHADANSVIVHAQIVGGERAATGVHASAAIEEGGVEVAENRAVTRAMIAAGLPALIDDLPPKLRSVPDTEATSRLVQFPTPEVDQTPSPIEESTEDSTSESDNESPEDISWTAFWRWARGAGYPDKVALEAALGRTINDLTPSEIRKRLLEPDSEM
jgi:hypothetical protein